MPLMLKFGPLLLTGALAAAIPECQSPRESEGSLTTQVQEMSGQLAELKKEFTDQELEVAALKASTISSGIFFKDIADIYSKLPNEQITLKPGSQGYQAINSQIGPLLILIKDIQPYANGYKLILQVGNPHTAAISQPEFDVTWYANLDGGAFNFAKTGSHTTHQQATVTIGSGTWTPVTLLLNPASKDEISNIDVSMSFSTVSLRNVPLSKD